MTRCKLCCIPDTRPDTAFVNGVCSACLSYRARSHIDWPAKLEQLKAVIAQAKARGQQFDCIVPSSGGKDSHWQVLELIKLGARPLVVTATTCHLTPIGRANIDNLARYATTIEVTPNTTVRAKLNKLGLTEVGDISWPEHASIFTTPFRMALAMGIPLIFYGECPQEAYGGPAGTETAMEMTPRWVSEFGGFAGMRASDLVGALGIEARDMADYHMPPLEALHSAGVHAYFLGQFLPWDSERNASVAAKAGMRYRLPTEACWWAWENCDNAQTGLHDHLMYRKYGYGRLCAQVSVEVRCGRMTRERAMELVQLYDGHFPDVYAGVALEDVLARINMTADELAQVLERFTNWALFEDDDLWNPMLLEFALDKEDQRS